MGSHSPQDETTDSWESRLRELLISVEIRTRCEEWRRGDVREPAISRALREAQRELRRGIWHLGVRESVTRKVAAPTACDPWLVAELRHAAAALRRAPKAEAASMLRIANALDALCVSLHQAEPGASRAGPFRQPGDHVATGADAKHRSTRQPQPENGRSETSSWPEIARASVFMALALGGVAAASTGLRALPLAMLILLAAAFVGIASAKRRAK